MLGFSPFKCSKKNWFSISLHSSWQGRILKHKWGMENILVLKIINSARMNKIITPVASQQWILICKVANYLMPSTITASEIHWDHPDWKFYWYWWLIGSFASVTLDFFSCFLSCDHVHLLAYLLYLFFLLHHLHIFRGIKTKESLREICEDRGVFLSVNNHLLLTSPWWLWLPLPQVIRNTVPATTIFPV